MKGISLMRNLKELEQTVCDAIDARKDEIIALGEWVYHHPETGYKEFKTSKHAVALLRGLGLSVRENLAITGFRADFNCAGPGPVFAVLAEMDALIVPDHPDADPATGNAHACGHHAQLAGLIGALSGLFAASAMNELSGKLAFIGVPAEEGIEQDYRKELIAQGKIKSISGKSQMIREHVFDDIDIAFMNHLNYRSGLFYADDHNGGIMKHVIFKGKSCHAASPQRGINALHAATLAQNAIALLRESFGPDGGTFRIHGIITNGGNAVSVIPNTITMEYMIRAPRLENLRELSARFDRAMILSARAVGADAVIETEHGFMPLANDPELGKVVGDAVAVVAPNDRYEFNTTYSSACTDMGDIAAIIPSVHGYVPGAGGISHSGDYRITVPYYAYVMNAKEIAVLAVELLYGGAARAKKIAKRKEKLMSVDEYIRTIDGFTSTASWNTIIAEDLF